MKIVNKKILPLLICLCLYVWVGDYIYAKSDIDFSKVVFEINIVGLKAVNKKSLPDVMGFNTKIGRRIIESSLMKDVDQLYLTGFFSSVEAQVISEDNISQLNFVVKENPVINKIIIRGQTVFSCEYLKSILKNKSGAVLNIKYVEEDKKTLEKLYLERRYDLFDVVSIEMDSENNLVYEIVEGRIESVEFKGLKAIKQFVLRRELSQKEGEALNSGLLKKDRERLLKLGYFSDVYAPNIQESLDGRDVKITYGVTEKKVNLFDLGLEQERDLVVGFVRMDYNHMFQHTDLVSGKVQLSSEDQDFRVRSYTVRYEQPWVFNALPVSIACDIWKEYKREYLSKDWVRSNVLENKREGADIIFGVPLIRDMLSVSAVYKNEWVRPVNDSEGVFDPYKVKSIAAVIKYQSVEEWHNPKNGTYWDIGVERGGSLGVVDLGGLQFTRYNFNAAKFIGITDKSTIGIHTSMGLFRPSDQNISTFEAEEYAIGGASSLRGYKETNPCRGLRKIQFNFEYRYDFSDSVQGVGFIDMGKAFDDVWDFELRSFYRSFGVGVRFFTPVGPFRVDLAFGESPIIHFGLGQVF
jgi:outer membrane protein insertion porin family